MTVAKGKESLLGTTLLLEVNCRCSSSPHTHKHDSLQVECEGLKEKVEERWRSSKLAYRSQSLLWKVLVPIQPWPGILSLSQMGVCYVPVDPQNTCG